MKVTVRYFARYRSLVGKGEEEVELPEGATVRDLIEKLRELHPVLKNEVFSEDDSFADVNVSRNGRYVGFDEILKEGDVVALFPPVSGG
ncbi:MULTISPECIES: ubiquitin-like small modifier protein 1 [Thermococcus]|uniref:Ubiquitin-like small modifier protein 1 n=1 Tax=Thermococcus waiotapuensis TaxID=90909 RepID=A0AAE4SYK9_9EURY|nr:MULTISPECIES: ubiquitin-like small modifier protein 1 [Thermococcus]MDV3103839.1 ubiquitin-like small modifier protein 1 [Thermococcus waiotapuensis]